MDAPRHLAPAAKEELVACAKQLALKAGNLAFAHLLPCQQPVPDMLGYLADCQVRSAELLQISWHLRAHWPLVDSLRCNLLDRRPRFTLCIQGCNDQRREAHRPLATWLRTQFPGLRNFEIGYLNPIPWKPWGRETLLYPDICLPQVIKLIQTES